MVNNAIENSVYDKLPNFTLGFHGCNEEVYHKVIYEHMHLRKSMNAYDWLGNGIYFWENSYERAMEWAINRYGKEAKVVGAVMSLGHCLNLTDYRSAKILKKAYDILYSYCNNLGLPMPENKKGRSETDLLLRNLDCAVIEQVHNICRKKSKDSLYDSVRGVFLEGGEVYPGAGISEKTHVQICIINPNCIKGYFSPIEPEKDYSIP